MDDFVIRTLVAFSGDVNDTESGPNPFAERSASLNPTLKGRDIREAFKGDEFRILLVANNFQTGFDQPLLCGMSVDKRLAGIQAGRTTPRRNFPPPLTRTSSSTFAQSWMPPATMTTSRSTGWSRQR